MLVIHPAEDVDSLHDVRGQERIAVSGKHGFCALTGAVCWFWPLIWPLGRFHERFFASAFTGRSGLSASAPNSQLTSLGTAKAAKKLKRARDADWTRLDDPAHAANTSPRHDYTQKRLHSEKTHYYTGAYGGAGPERTADWPAA